MATTIKIKNNNVASKKPASLQPAELAVNLADKKLYVGASDSSVIELTQSWDTLPDAPDIPENTSDLTNDGSDGTNPFLSEAEVKNILQGKNPDGTPNSDPDAPPPIPGELGDLSDCDTTGETNGNVLSFNGSQWVPSAAPPADITGSSIKQLNDVSDGMLPTDGQVLTWDSTEWTAKDPSGIAVTPDLQAVTDEGSTTTNGAKFGGQIEATGYRIDLLPDLPADGGGGYMPKPPAPEPNPSRPEFVLSGGAVGSGGLGIIGTLDVIDFGDS